MNWKHIRHTFFTGWAILIVAIATNSLAAQFGLSTWYDWLTRLANGTAALSLMEFVFLFVAYPFVLGGTAVLMLKRLGKNSPR